MLLKWKSLQLLVKVKIVLVLCPDQTAKFGFCRPRTTISDLFSFYAEFFVRPIDLFISYNGGLDGVSRSVQIW